MNKNWRCCKHCLIERHFLIKKYVTHALKKSSNSNQGIQIITNVLHSCWALGVRFETWEIFVVHFCTATRSHTQLPLSFLFYPATICNFFFADGFYAIFWWEKPCGYQVFDKIPGQKSREQNRWGRKYQTRNHPISLLDYNLQWLRERNLVRRGKPVWTLSPCSN